METERSLPSGLHKHRVHLKALCHFIRACNDLHTYAASQSRHQFDACVDCILNVCCSTNLARNTGHGRHVHAVTLRAYALSQFIQKQHIAPVTLRSAHKQRRNKQMACAYFSSSTLQAMCARRTRALALNSSVSMSEYNQTHLNFCMSKSSRAHDKTI